MAKKMELPKIGVNMTEAVIAKWLVKVGDVVKEGDAIIEAETDKSTQEIYATQGGKVAKLLFEEGETAQCFDDILILVDEGETYTEDAEPQIQKTAVVQSQAVPTATAKTAFVQNTIAGKNRVIASPLAKKIAKEMGIDLSKISYTGKRIVKNDVLEYAKMASKVNTQTTMVKSLGENMDIIPMSAVRKVISQRMSQSNLEKPCAALTLSADMKALLALKNTYKCKDIKLSIDALMAKVVAKALTVHRNINSVLEGDNILIKRDINIGVAVDTPKGLTVPVIANADIKPLSEIGGELAQLAEEAKEGSLGVENMQGGTFTITNLGMFGIEQFTPVINPPECCILALGAVKKVFVPNENDEPVLASTMQMTLVFDHRIVDGAPAAKFLKLIKDYVECPELLI